MTGTACRAQTRRGTTPSTSTRSPSRMTPGSSARSVSTAIYLLCVSLVIISAQVGAAPGVAPVRSRYAVLTVTVRPEAPVILAEDAEVRTQEDRVLSLECVSRGGKPAAEVHMIIFGFHQFMRTKECMFF